MIRTNPNFGPIRCRFVFSGGQKKNKCITKSKQINSVNKVAYLDWSDSPNYENSAKVLLGPNQISQTVIVLMSLGGQIDEQKWHLEGIGQGDLQLSDFIHAI